MKKTCFWVGILCLLYVSLGLFLPVNAWGIVLDLFIDREPNAYYKIVPTEGANNQIIIVLLVGIALIAYAKFMPSKRK